METVANFSSSLLNGLMGYFGGKRKIARLVAGLVKGERFLDLFFGGGAVGLYVKAAGKRVTAVDHSFFSEVIGKSLLQNRNEILKEQDLWRFFEPGDAGSDWTLMNCVPDLFSPRHAVFMDKAVSAANRVRNETTRNLLLMV